MGFTCFKGKKNIEMKSIEKASQNKFLHNLKFARKNRGNDSFILFCRIQFETLTLKSRKYIQAFLHIQ